MTGRNPIVWREVQEPTEALESDPSPDLISGAADGPIAVAPAFAVSDEVVFAPRARALIISG